MVSRIEDLFPGLRQSGFRVTSPATPEYNCVAWAAGRTDRWWWPDPDLDNDAVYWPPGAPREESLAAFVTAFVTSGYEPCASQTVESGFEKVALFAGPDGVPTHAARQLASGLWTSKLGNREDIEHALDDLSGTEYGAVVQILRRPVPAS